MKKINHTDILLVKEYTRDIISSEHKTLVISSGLSLVKYFMSMLITYDYPLNSDIVGILILGTFFNMPTFFTADISPNIFISLTDYNISSIACNINLVSDIL